MSPNSIIIVIIIFTLYLNVIATYHVLKSDSYESIQKKLQILIAWVIPVLGSIGIIAFALSDKGYVRGLKSNGGTGSKILSLLTLAVFFSSGVSSVSSTGTNENNTMDSGGSNSGSDN